MWHTLELHSYWLPLANAIPTILLHDPAFLSHRDDRGQSLVPLPGLPCALHYRRRIDTFCFDASGKANLVAREESPGPRIRVLHVGESEVTEGPNRGIKSHGSSASGDRILKAR